MLYVAHQLLKIDVTRGLDHGLHERPRRKSPIEPRSGSHSNRARVSGSWRSTHPSHGSLRLEDDRVKPLRAWDRLTQILAALMVLVCGSAPSSPIGARPFPSASNPSGARAQELSSGGQTWLRAAITSGNFADLRWPDFNDYSKAGSEILRTQREFIVMGQRNGADPSGARSDRVVAPGRARRDFPPTITTGPSGATG